MGWSAALVLTALAAFIDAGRAAEVSQAACAVDSYYSSVASELTTLTGTRLDTLLHDLIAGHRGKSYDAAWEALKLVDAFQGDPSTGKVLLTYRNVGVDADSTDGNGVDDGEWNREHTWPKAFQVFKSGADYADLHHLTPSDTNVNRARDNLYFDWCNATQAGCTVPAHSEAASDTGLSEDAFMPPASRRGNVARMIFYMATRYDGTEDNTFNLQLSNCPDAAQGLMGNLSTLLEWHQLDPPDALERRRNDLVCSKYQGNRNPFVDFPELVDRIYATWTEPNDSCEPASALPPSPPSPAPAPVSGLVGLAAGDLIFVALNSDTPKSFAVLATTYIDAGVTFTVTDAGWQSASQGLTTTEGFVSFTTPAGGLPAGTVVQYTETGPRWEKTGPFAPSSSGDALLLFSGTMSDPVFVAALKYSGATWDAEGPQTSRSSALPPGIVPGKSAVAFPHVDNLQYNGPMVGSRGFLLSAVGAPANWAMSNSQPFSSGSLVFQVICADSDPSGILFGDGATATCSELAGLCNSERAVHSACPVSCGACESAGLVSPLAPESESAAPTTLSTAALGAIAAAAAAILVAGAATAFVVVRSRASASASPRPDVESGVACANPVFKFQQT